MIIWTLLLNWKNLSQYPDRLLKFAAVSMQLLTSNWSIFDVLVVLFAGNQVENNKYFVLVMHPLNKKGINGWLTTPNSQNNQSDQSQSDTNSKIPPQTWKIEIDDSHKL